MISKRLMTSFQITFKTATFFGIVPFDYNVKEKKLAIKTSTVKKLISLFALSLFLAKFTFTVFVLTKSLDNWRENLQDISLAGFLAVIMWNNATFQVNIWKNMGQVCYTFNQISEFNARFSLHKKSTWPEMIMLTWIPGHLNILVTQFTEFLRHPTAHHHIFSALPSNLQSSNLFFVFYATLEGFCTFAFIWNSLFEFSTQTVLLKSMIFWTHQIKLGVVENTKGAVDTIRSFKMCAVLLKSYNNLYGYNIEQIKTTFTCFCVICNFLVIRCHKTISAGLMGFLIDCIMFCHSLPPLLYNNAYQLRENTFAIKTNLILPSKEQYLAQSGELIRRVARSLLPLSVRVNGMYFLDRTLTPMYLWIIFSYTCSMLVS